MHFKKSSHFFLPIYVLCTSGQQITAVMTGFIDALKTNFADRFDHFSIPAEVKKFVKDPFCLNVEGEFASKAKELVVSDGRLYNLNSLTFSHQMTCVSHYRWQVLKCFGHMKSARRNYLIQGVSPFLSSQCLALLTRASHHSHT